MAGSTMGGGGREYWGLYSYDAVLGEDAVLEGDAVLGEGACRVAIGADFYGGRRADGIASGGPLLWGRWGRMCDLQTAASARK